MTTDTTMTPPTDASHRPAVAGPVERVVGRLEPERDQGGEPDFDDRDEDFDDWVCDRCHGDGAGPWTDYLLPCPACQGEQR